MNITYPHVIENCIGEKLIFQELQKEPNGDRLLVENYVAPGSGPVMHTHWLQDEGLTVIEGIVGYQIKGGPKKYAGKGESVTFKRGTPHYFWNEGKDTLHCKGWLKPANTIVFFFFNL
jgi:quercetin dioxygenase-like cupin family protein